MGIFLNSIKLKTIGKSDKVYFLIIVTNSTFYNRRQFKIK